MLSVTAILSVFLYTSECAERRIKFSSTTHLLGETMVNIQDDEQIDTAHGFGELVFGTIFVMAAIGSALGIIGSSDKMTQITCGVILFGAFLGIVAVLFWPWVKQYFTPAKSAENHYNTRKDWGAKGAYHDSHFN